jgi:hypothetical protein
MPDLTKTPRERAETALDAANQLLREPAGGTYENAQVIATMAVAEALLAVEAAIRAAGQDVSQYAKGQ